MATPNKKILALAPNPIPEGLSLVPMAILLWNPDQGALWANPTFEKEYGSVDQHPFTEPKKLILADHRPLSYSVFEQEGRHEGFSLKTPTGETVQIDVRVSKISTSQPTADVQYLVLIDNVQIKADLQRKLVEEHLKLQQSQKALIQTAKLASLGELSSGIAHELNQPLQAVLGFSQELKSQEKLSPVGQEYLADMVHAALKMRDIIKSLRTFARESGEAIEEVSIEVAVQEVLQIMRHTLLQSGVEVDCMVDVSLPLVHANAIQLEQVLMNLLSNSKDAIESSGKRYGKIIIEAKAIQDKIIISVSDNGCGMPEGVQKKIFDPFFTTKPVGKGTGLGLSISMGILNRWQAKTKVKSKVNEGTKIEIQFPNPQTQKFLKTKTEENT
jgi:C4-dicarboxylate-specific signal transduction histidine kinase